MCPKDFEFSLTLIGETDNQNHCYNVADKIMAMFDRMFPDMLTIAYQVSWKFSRIIIIKELAIKLWIRPECMSV